MQLRRAMLVSLVTSVLLAAATLVSPPRATPATNGGTVVAWGDNWDGATDIPAGLSDVTAIAAGFAHNVALTAGGTVVAWGQNAQGQTDVPAGLSGVTAVAAGTYTSLAMTDDGTVVAWGWNDFGQTDVPPVLSGVTAIAAGYGHSLAVTAEGIVVGWGDNTYGQADVPAGLSGVVAVAAGTVHSLALTADGTVVAWGANDTFQDLGQTDVPDGLAGVVAIAAGEYHSLALRADGTVVAWGDTVYGQTDVPASLTGVIAIAGSAYHSLALTDEGTVVAWGANIYNQTEVPAGLSGVIAIAASWHHSVAVVGVSDTTPPVLALPADITVDATSPFGATVAYSISATDPDDTVVSSWCSPPSGSTFPIGTTTVNCSATDGHGNTATGSFLVIVKGAPEHLVDLHARVVGVGPGTSLVDKVHEAQSQLAPGDTAGACETLSAFIRQVRAQSDKSILMTDAAQLLADAHGIRAMLACQ